MLRYVIQPYENLFSIAQKFGFTNAQILAANPQVSNIEPIFAGQILNIPGFAYDIRAGDTINEISQKFNIPFNLLIATNPQILNSNIKVGQKIYILKAEIPDTHKKLLEIENNANDIINDIDKNDWNEANSKLNTIKNNFNELKPMLQSSSISKDLLNIINNAIVNLEKELSSQNVHESKVQAFIIAEYVPDILDFFNIHQ